MLRGSGGQRLYNPQNSAFDVEVLELAANSTATPIKLAGADEGALWSGGRTAFVTGWGSTVPGGGGYPDGLRVASVKMASDAQCANAIGNLFVQSVMVCAGAPPSRDTCDGDSGGPLVVPMLGGGYRLVGDTSFGLNEPCGQHFSAYGRLGADPLRSLIRTKVMQVAGVDVVGSGGKPPTGGGGDTLTATQARDRAWLVLEAGVRRRPSLPPVLGRPLHRPGHGLQLRGPQLREVRPASQVDLQPQHRGRPQRHHDHRDAAEQLELPPRLAPQRRRPLALS